MKEGDEIETNMNIFWKFKCVLGRCVCVYIYVVVNFLSQVIFIFILFLGMVIYGNEVETKEK